MHASDPQVASLSTLYQQACSYHQQVMDSQGATDGNILKSAEQRVVQCQAAVDQLALFSSNEDADDIATADLKFLLVPAMHGDILAQTRTTEPEVRRHILQSAVQSYSSFLNLCDQYGLLSEAAKAAARKDHHEPLDQNTRRQQKIQRFKREREIKAQLTSAHMKRARVAQLDAEDGDSPQATDDDDRELQLLQIELQTIKAGEQITMLHQEMELLQHAVSGPDDEQQREPQPPPPDIMRHLTGAANSMQQQRQNLQAQVFRPTAALPTVSVEQQGMVELQRMQQREAALASHQTAAEDSDEDSDAKVDKQRAWDDWKDANPSGWGNSKLRPTA